MKLEHAEQIVEHIEGEGGEASLYEDYSGRGMYGSTTAGVVADSASSVARALAALGITERLRHDSMGLDIIVY